MPIHEMVVAGVTEGGSQNVIGMPKGTAFLEYITGIKVYQSASNKSLIPSGTIFKVYGIRIYE